MYCVYCGVKLQDGAKDCPLCHTPVPVLPGTETEGKQPYSDRLPAEEQHHGRALLVWLLTVVMAAVCLGCLIFCHSA